MASPKLGQGVVVKYVGGELVVRQVGTDSIAMREKLEETKKRALDLRPVYEAFHPIWQQSIRTEIFAANGGPNPWPALSPAYAIWKARHAPGKPLMRLTDALFDSLVSGGAGQVWQVTQRTIRKGVNLPYFMRHQQGNAMPRRPTLILTPAAFGKLRSATGHYVLTGEVRFDG